MFGRLLVIVLIVSGAAFPCLASTIVALSPGSLPGTAQDLTGLLPTEIVGTLAGSDSNAVNMFKIAIEQPLNFSAITVGPSAFGIPDTVLSLFNSGGMGVYLNDDISGSNTLSCLPSNGVSNPCPAPAGGLGPLTVGNYYLAISRSANYPVDSSSHEIFNPSSSTDVVGPSVSNPVTGWDNGAFTSPDFDLVNYDIMLTGTTPEPGTLALLTGAFALLIGWRLARQVNSPADRAASENEPPCW